MCEYFQTACLNSSDCQSVANCIDACSDATCGHQCADDNPTGAELYNATLRCMICTLPACWADCASSNPTCGAWGTGD